MSKKIYLVLMFVISINLFSQQRIDGQQIKFEAIGKSLSEAVGWRYDDVQNKWIETKKDNLGQNSSSSINFYEIFFTKINYNNTPYYILNINYLDGAYKYPAIKKDFYVYNVIRSYIFSENDFNNIKNYQNITTNYYPFITFIDSKTITKKDIESLTINTISALKSNSTSSYSKYEMKIKKEDEKVVRFVLPFKSGETFLEKSWGFEKQYFEVDKEKMDVIFNL